MFGLLLLLVFQALKNHRCSLTSFLVHTVRLQKKYKQTKHEILYIIIQLKLHNNSTIRLLSSHYIIETKTCHHCRVSPPLLKIFVKGMVTIFRKNKKNNFNIKCPLSVFYFFSLLPARGASEALGTD